MQTQLPSGLGHPAAGLGTFARTFTTTLPCICCFDVMTGGVVVPTAPSVVVAMVVVVAVFPCRGGHNMEGVRLRSCDQLTCVQQLIPLTPTDILDPLDELCGGVLHRL
eukprot:Hpha_TRINITY_DN10794_c0_g2::TRINITY_DN10794_c0_g2_i1::g.43727::m.43727